MSAIGLYVHENEDESMEDLIARQLKELSEHGCRINLERSSFSVRDINLFTEYMLNTTFSGWPSPESAFSLGKLVHDAFNTSYMNLPTYYDGEPYNSLFDALRWSMFSNEESNGMEYMLSGVYEGLY